jgi:WD40 repeat protein
VLSPPGLPKQRWPLVAVKATVDCAYERIYLALFIGSAGVLLYAIWTFPYLLLRYPPSLKPKISLPFMFVPFMSVPRSLQHTLAGHTGPVNVAIYSAGAAKYCLSGGQDRTVRLWNPGTGLEIKRYQAHGYEVLSLSWYVSATDCSTKILSKYSALRIMRNLFLREETRPCSTGTCQRGRRCAA